MVPTETKRYYKLRATVGESMGENHSRHAAIALAIFAAIGVTGTARAQEAFRIGVVEDLNGTYSGNGGPNSVLATRMAVEDFGGTVLGRPIEVIAVDHQTKPDVGVALTRQLIDQGRVSMLNIGGSSGVGLAVQNLARERKVVSIQSGNYAASITGKACSPYGTQWAVSTTALARSAAGALLRTGAKTWYLIEADYAFGHDLANDVQQTVEAGGGKVVGRTLHPLATTDMSAPLLQAQASRADMIAFANAGPDLVNSVKQSKEFGITNTAALLVFINNVVAMGLDTAQGLRFSVSFYWDSNEPSRAFARRFMARNGGTGAGHEPWHVLHRDAALPAGRAEGRQRRLGCRQQGHARGAVHGRDAQQPTHPDQRHRRDGPHADPSEGAGGVQVSQRRLQDPGHRSVRQAVPDGGTERLHATPAVAIPPSSRSPLVESGDGGPRLPEQSVEY